MDGASAAQAGALAPFAVGELAPSSPQQHATIFDALQNLPQACVASAEEVIGFIGVNDHGLGIGYVNACLLTSAQLMPSRVPWTLDKRPAAAAAATRMGEAADLLH